MAALTPRRRRKTAREAAEQFDVTPRTVRKYIAEPRVEYLARAKQRRAQVVMLREQGLPWAAIAEQTGQSVEAARSLLRAARVRGEIPEGSRAELQPSRVVDPSEEQARRAAALRARADEVKDEQYALLKELHESGVSVAAIARALRLTPRRVSRVLDAEDA